MGICKDKAEFVKTLVDSYFKGCGEPLSCGDADYTSFEQMVIPSHSASSFWQSSIFNDGSVIGELYRRVKNLPNIRTDLENFDAGWISDGGEDVLATAGSGECYLKFHGGGDGEKPFDAILYVEDGGIKVYVPEDGNCIDAKYHCAWGQEWMMDGFDDDDEWGEKVRRMLDGEDDDGFDSVKERDDIERFFAEREKDGRDGDPGLFWMVDVSKFCLRRGRNGNPGTVSAQGRSSYPNIFKTRDEALEYAHLMMMLNHGAQVHDWERFSKVVKVFEGGGNADADFGYVHEGAPSIEWFTWFDKRGQYLCVIDTVTIREVKAQAVDDGGNPVPLQAVQVQHCFSPEGVDEFTREEHERHQEIADAMADEIGGLETMCASDRSAEYERMKKMLGWDDEG